MRKTIIALTVFGVGVLLATPIVAQQAATMKKLLASGKSVPTGIDVPGPTFYEWNKAPGSAKYFDHQTSARNADRFWDLQGHYGSGSSAGGAGGSN